jgi:uncharacterized membrane-anchored protein YjiN (DUF445 family)
LNDPQSHTSLTLDKWWDGVVNGKEALNLVENCLDQYLGDALEDLEDDESRILLHVELAIGRLVDKLKADDESRNRVSLWVNQHLASFVLSNHSNIAQIVKDTLKKNFPNEKLVSWIEDKVGGDLQYIRLNGALVGGLVGLTIHLAKTVLV